MLSPDQQREKDLKILKTTSEFINRPVSLDEISKITGFSSSSVQRYLNDKRIRVLLGEEVYQEIQELLKFLKKNALSAGGTISSSKNEPIRNQSGQFIGNKRK